MFSWPAKDPDEVLDYQFNWTDRLEAGETIATSTMLVASGDVVIDSESNLGEVTTVWLSGGTDSTVSIITNRITTSALRTYEESARLRIRSTV